MFDKGRADLGKRRPGLFTSDLGTPEDRAAKEKRRCVALIPDDPVQAARKLRRRGSPVAPASEFTPEERLEWTDATARFDAAAKLANIPPGPSMLEQLAKAKSERAAAKAANVKAPKPDGALSMLEQLALARARAGKT
jgi:hypothetical protein